MTVEVDLPETVLMIVIAETTLWVVPEINLMRRFASSRSFGLPRLWPWDSPTVSTPIIRAFLKWFDASLALPRELWMAICSAVWPSGAVSPVISSKFELYVVKLAPSSFRSSILRGLFEAKTN